MKMVYSKVSSVYNGMANFFIPAFSQILNLIPDEYMNIEIIYSLDAKKYESDTSKSISIRIEEGRIHSYSSINTFEHYKYWNSFYFNTSSLIKNGLGIEVANESKILHVFYTVIEPFIEIRDRKIDSILNRD